MWDLNRRLLSALEFCAEGMDNLVPSIHNCSHYSQNLGVVLQVYFGMGQRRTQAFVGAPPTKVLVVMFPAKPQDSVETDCRLDGHCREDLDCQGISLYIGRFRVLDRYLQLGSDLRYLLAVCLLGSLEIVQKAAHGAV